MSDTERVKQSTDLVELIGSVIDLRREGKNYIGRCPWHDDSKPSLSVSPEHQTWRCWVCDIRGDAIDWISRHEGLEFLDALRRLADRAGIKIEEEPEQHKALYSTVRWAAEEYHKRLLSGDKEATAARAYLKSRGVTKETVQEFRIGYAPDEWQFLCDAAKPGLLHVLEDAGLAQKSDKSGRHFDLFRGRIIFPICDVRGRPVALGGRILPELEHKTRGKYYNSPATPIFSKGASFYALHKAREHTSVGKGRSILVLEGFMDVVMAHQYGIRNAVAIMGTSLTVDHVRTLKRYADRTYLVLDGDAAGRTKATQALEIFLQEDADVRIAALPDGSDPCDFLRESGPDRFRSLLIEAVDALDYRVRGALIGVETRKAHDAIEAILKTLARIPNEDASQKIREQLVLARLGQQFGVDPGVLLARLGELH